MIRSKTYSQPGAKEMALSKCSDEYFAGNQGGLSRLFATVTTAADGLDCCAFSRKTLRKFSQNISCGFNRRSDYTGDYTGITWEFLRHVRCSLT
jgi:hypothetical protein